ncbi:MAG TPA: 4Fe-4S dicluster domain-containing protein [Methanomassiliicoccales archaeon]|nr:4Fe-4S dicluster domain-containing protein [Methanomassiliicoccales archaeon]
MRRTKVYRQPDLAVTEALAELEVWRCHECGQCTSVCPSGRHGGISTRAVIERAALGTIDAATDEDLWLCTMCHSCSERCQLGVDPATVIAQLREEASREGNLPSHFRDEARQFKSTAFSFPNTGMTKKMRRELGLPELSVSERALDDAKKIVSRTRLGRLKLD